MSGSANNVEKSGRPLEAAQNAPMSHARPAKFVFIGKSVTTKSHQGASPPATLQLPA